MGTFEFVLGMATLILGTGWLFTYRSYRRKASGEATVAEADGWKSQQEVYQNTIEDMKATCEYIRNDRNMLREENDKLRAENNYLREKIIELEDTISELKKEVSRLGRKMQALSEEKVKKGKKKDEAAT